MQVDQIKSSDHSVSFNVDTVGVPVLVKVSYFPNWQASGAKGPYRVAPNLMVVIPTSHHVTVHYGYTPVDWFGYLFGIMGLAALVWLVRAKPVAFANAGRALASTPDVVAVAGLDEAYVRMQRELAAGMGAGAPGQAGASGTDEIDAWLGFPGGLGPAPGAVRGSGAPDGAGRATAPEGRAVRRPRPRSPSELAEPARTERLRRPMWATTPTARRRGWVGRAGRAARPAMRPMGLRRRSSRSATGAMLTARAGPGRLQPVGT